MVGSYKIMSAAGIVLFLFSIVFGYSGGNGTSTDPYLIATPEDLNSLGATPGDWIKCFKMTADINMAEFTPAQYKIIGNYSSKFMGTFDGNGHKIYKLTSTTNTIDLTGIFGYAERAVIKNLGVEDINFSGYSSYKGALAGYAFSCTISECHSTGKIDSSYLGTATGGLIGHQDYGVVRNCHSSVSIKSRGYIGGLIGYQSNGDIKNCYSTGPVVSTDNSLYAGGLIGYSLQGRITNSYATGTVTSTYYAGGLVGRNGAIINNCYAIGAVSGGYNKTGGLVGYNAGPLQNCFWDIESSQCSSGIGAGFGDGISGKTTAEMKLLSTFTNAGWDIADIYGSDRTVWIMMPDGEDYPKIQFLYWQDLLAAAPPLLGSGTQANPYQINSAEDFIDLSNYCSAWAKYIILTADIDLDNFEVFPIGNAFVKFTGNFDGQGFAVRNVRMEMSEKNYVGLFGRVDKHAAITNLGVEDVNIGGKKFVGGMIGFNGGATISNCYTSGGYVKPNASSFAGGLIGFSTRAIISDCNSEVNIIGSGLNIGGLVGCNGKRNIIFNCYASGTITDVNSYRFGSSAGGLVGNNSGKIEQSYSDCDITAFFNSSSEQFNLGGLAGDNTNGLITSCYANGNISFTSNPSTALINTGGVLGLNVYSDVNDCYSTGEISFSCGAETQYIVGGIVGWNVGKAITRCYSRCVIGCGPTPEADYGVGGAVGLDSNSVVSGCFWDIETSGKTISGGGKGLTTEQMKTMLLYQNAGWADNGWVMNDGAEYPRLEWEGTGGVPIGAEEDPPFTGSGTEADPYQIWTAADFAYLSWYKSIIDKHFILMADIDLENVRIHPISEFGPFTGSFDGNGHKIINVSIYEPAGSYTGLFGRVGAGAEIKNLDIRNVNIVGGDYTGGLIGKNDGGTISNCGTTGKVDGFTCVGGLIGKSTGTVDRCYSKADTTAWEDMTSCVGGLIGQSGNSITYSYASGAATCRYSGYSTAGGLVGRDVPDSNIQYCYSCGYVSAEGKSVKKGGLLGFIKSNTYRISWNKTGYHVSNSYWDRESSGMTTSAGSTTTDPNKGAIGRTTAQMQTPSTYKRWSIGEPKWPGIWTMYPPSYPCLTWQLDIPAPNVISMTQANANNTIIAAGFTVGTITKAYSDSIPVGCVASQNPAAGEKSLEGIPVNLVISSNFDEGGNEITPHLISDANGLLALAAATSEYNKYFILTNDIDMTGKAVYNAIIAPDTDPNSTFHGTAFTGTFDGKGYKIKHLTINVRSSGSYIGLFGKINAGTVKNLGLEDLRINTSRDSYYIGGLVGYNYGGSIDNCYSTGYISSYSVPSGYVGGLAGVNLSNINNSYSKCSVTGMINVGGLAGTNTNTGNVKNCYATGVVSGSGDIGGLVGLNNGSISYCYSIGYVNDSYMAGGIVAYNRGSVSESFWDINTSGQTTSAAGIGKTTIEMKTLTTFTNAGWDFSYSDGDEADWFMPENEYPIFTWQISPADIYIDGRNNFKDFGILAKYWMRDDCAIYNYYCEWADLDFNGSVDLDDLIEFMDYWLEEGIYN